MINFWDSVYEQERVKTELKKICKTRRAPHAFIFSGPEGVGKFNTAIQFAKSLSIAIHPELSEESSKKISELQEPYIKLIHPLPRGKGESSEDSGIEKLGKDVIEEIQLELKKKIGNPFHRISIEGANTIKISSIREIKKYLSLSEAPNTFRFVLILDAHLMNDRSQNALLKSLEEPPENVIFILLTSSKENLLPTVISRCRDLTFDPLSKSLVSKILVSHFDIDKKLANRTSLFAEGSVQKALSLIEYDIEIVLEKTVSILRYSFAKRYQTAFSELNEFASTHSQDSFAFLLRMIRFWMADALRNRKMITDYSFEEFRDTFEKFNQRFSSVDLSIPFSKLENLETMMQKNINLNVLFLNIIFELSAVVKRN
jgi:DNA polymerase III subunit delta'